MDINPQKLIFDTTEEDFQLDMEKNNISEKMLDESIEHIVQWFKMQPHYPDLSKDDPRLKRCLAANSYSTEETKRVLENIFTARSLMPEYFIDLDIRAQKIKDALSTLDFFYIPKLTPERYRVYILRLNTQDSTKFDPLYISCLSTLFEDFRRLNDCTMDSVGIYDYSNFTVGHLLKLNPSVIKNMNFIAKDCYGGKFKGMHILNAPSFGHNLMVFIRSIMPKKINERLHFHRGCEGLLEFIPKECLPIEYGGTCGTIVEHNDNLQKCLDSEEVRKILWSYQNEKSDESKRPETSKINLDFSSFGAEGSFRLLDID